MSRWWLGWNSILVLYLAGGAARRATSGWIVLGARLGDFKMRLRKRGGLPPVRRPSSGYPSLDPGRLRGVIGKSAGNRSSMGDLSLSCETRFPLFADLQYLLMPFAKTRWSSAMSSPQIIASALLFSERFVRASLPES